MNYVTLSFRLRNIMCHTFLLRERESGGELGQMHEQMKHNQIKLRFLVTYIAPTRYIQ